ncbi:4Fe-4S dicluster domain-containing protein [Pelovirga terrestris]|uniref:4Fe-4S dicluster domain-containing protein n=1 Tax=Pelovirga terrestris TaxID=2771352 RepID=A0A8J6UIR6_9BACT|nr:4Fe-4S dicluster domain-containing protein [Pelovirga terrestris]MBD1401565.1 4Fe-4S dicluster domain-containing protein [Pelovirga terrestris]
MLKILRERFRQGYRTFPYLKKDPVIAERFRGRPQLPIEPCALDCHACRDACPYGAVQIDQGRIGIDLGLCTFCGDCATACPSGTLTFSCDHRLATRKRDDLRVGPAELQLAAALDKRMKKLFGRSLKLRQVSAGGCNACEADINVLGTLVFDLGRYGIQFVASPRHADGLLVTGPVTENMKSALLDTYAAVPEPKLVIASGACAIGGGPFRGSPEVNNGIGDLLPVDLYIPGCPPHPWTTLDGLLRLLGRLEGR